MHMHRHRHGEVGRWQGAAVYIYIYIYILVEEARDKQGTTNVHHCICQLTFRIGRQFMVTVNVYS